MKNQTSRKREFSEVRMSHSRINGAKTNQGFSPSRISQSKFIPENSNRIPSFRHQHDNNMVCLDCYNKKLLENKHERQNKSRKKQQQAEITALNRLQNSNNTKNKYLNEVKKVNEYNLKKMDENKKNKQIERSLTPDPHLKQKQYLKDLQSRRNYDYEKRMKLKQQLQNQINFAKMRRQKLLEEQKNIFIKPIIDKPIPNQQRKIQMQKEYKNTLIQQINQKIVRKQIQSEKEKKENDENINQLQFVTFAQKKRQIAEQQSQKFKQIAREETKRKQERQKAKKQIQNKQRQEQQANRKQLEQNYRFQRQLGQDKRRNLINKYLMELKEQMKSNKTKRQEDFKWLKQQTQSIIIKHQPKQNIQSCGSCEKQYPKQYLSPFITIKQS